VRNFLRGIRLFLLGRYHAESIVSSRNVAATWRRSVTPSLHFASPQPKCETTIRGWQSITGRWPRPRNLALRLPDQPNLHVRFWPCVPLGCLGMNDQDHISGPRPSGGGKSGSVGPGPRERSLLDHLTQESNAGRQRRVPGPKVDATRLTTRALAPSESFRLAVFEFEGPGNSLSTRSTGRPAHLHGLLPPILSAHGYDLAHLLWYVYCDFFLLSRCLLSGCTHRRYDHNDRDRG